VSPHFDPLLPVQISRLECLWLLRTLRKHREMIWENLMAIEERIRGGFDVGHMSAAHHAIDADLMICDGLIRSLWQHCGVRMHERRRQDPRDEP
jgi:hypothetical protein